MGGIRVHTSCATVPSTHDPFVVVSDLVEPMKPNQGSWRMIRSKLELRELRIACCLGLDLLTLF
jgi:hypothetical protein